MKTLPDHKCSEKVKPGNEIRMGREVPIIKNASCCDSEKDAKCPDKKEKTREDRASSLV
jgi:hypothetical protein